MQMLIDGKWVDAADGGVNDILDNATGGLIETAPHGSALDVTCANEAAQGGRRAMAAMPSHERAADALQADRAALSLLLAREGLHETLLDKAEQKALLMSGMFSA